ncbi:MAG: leucine--tRNA ligase [Desulfurococcaceae archaeon]
MNCLSQRRQEFLEWLRGVERKWQRIWKEKRVFEADSKEGVSKYFITVPYPYANGPLHIGHGRTYTIGDIIARYKRLKGLNVLYPMAFHITGTPIIAFSEMIARGDPKTITLYREYIRLYAEDEKQVDEILESFKDPLNLAVFFAEKIQRDFEELGYSIDWRRKFHTGEPMYNRFVTWQYYKLLERGLITRGDHIVTYCLLHNQPEGEDDIQDADVNPVEVVEYTAVKFKLVGTGEYLLAGTLRPETLFGVTNIWVNPEAEYAVFEWNGERYVVSSKALVKFMHQYPGEEVRLVNYIKGAELLGKWSESPLGDRVIVLPAWFVDPDNATGIVYSEPSDAPYDYVALMELKSNPQLLEKFNIDPSLVLSIEPRKIIGIAGVEAHHAKLAVERAGITSQLDPRLEDISREVYKEQFYGGVMIIDNPEFKGLSVREAREKIRVKLYNENNAIPFYELNRKAWCRAGGEIIVAKITGQWFINYNVKWLKERARRALENDEVKIIPAKYKKLFLDTIDWLDKRPCARKRGIGTRLPWSTEWIIESLSDSTIYMALYTISHIIREHNIPPELLIPEVFDYIFLGHGSPEDTSSKSNIPIELLSKMRQEFTYWYPVDHRHTAMPHITNHLTFYILHHFAIFPEEYMPRTISLNETVIREGAKMSKSKGNVIPLRHIITMYSADLFRLYISWAAGLDSVLDWREAEVDRVVNSLVKFTNIAKVAVEAECREVQDNVFTEWFISKFYELLAKASSAIENLEIRDYAQAAFFDVLALIDKYRDMVGEKFICGVKRVLPDWITVLNPVIPHITEEINSWLGREHLLSTSKWPEIGAVKEEIITLMDSVESLISDIKELLELVKRPEAKVYVIVAPEWKREVARMVLEGLPLKAIIDVLRTKFGLKGREAEIVDAYNVYKKTERSMLESIIKTKSKSEYTMYVETMNYIKARLPGVREVVVLWEDEARTRNIPKAERALPLKPAIYLE